jgi:aldehyde:ferredoxin oxidoreductase
MGLLPTRNYRQGVFEGAEQISGEQLHEHYKVKTIACAQCPIGCEQMCRATDGPYSGAMSGVEYESLYALAPNCGISDPQAAIKLVEICDRGGMDTMSAGVTLSWAIETFERGIFTAKDLKTDRDPEGFELGFGRVNEVIRLLEMIRDREGLGDLLSRGTRKASATVDAERGTETFKWAMNVKGLELPGYDARALKTFALGLAVGTRGACHNRTAAYDPDISGDVDRFSVDETRGELAKDTEEYAAVYDTLPLCKFIRRCFTGQADRAGSWPAIARLINATTGWDYTEKDIDLIGERAHTIKKAFNIREGWKREDDHLPYRWQYEPMEEGPSAGSVVTAEELEYLKNLYYKAKGWTEDGLIPKQKLTELGMDDVAEEIGV